jgi:hypothetical protein
MSGAEIAVCRLRRALLIRMLLRFYAKADFHLLHGRNSLIRLIMKNDKRMNKELLTSPGHDFKIKTNAPFSPY